MFQSTARPNTSQPTVVHIPPTHCPQPPTDTPTDLSWYWPSPQAQPLLCATSWDGTARVWEVRTNSPLHNRPTSSYEMDPLPVINTIEPKAMYTHTCPLLSNQFVRTGPSLILGGTDGKIMTHNLQTNQSVQVGQHEAPVRRVYSYEKKSLICGVSWDNTVKWWDGRSPTPAAQLVSPDKVPVTDADMNGDLLAVALVDKRIFLYDLRIGLDQSKKYTQEPLQISVNAIKLFPNQRGAVLAGMEGRCRVFHFDQFTASQKNGGDFTFRAHRTGEDGKPVLGAAPNASNANIYPVHGLDFNPIYGTLLTVGGDGYTYVWDKENRNKLYYSPPYGDPITCGAFDTSGRLLAMGLGYDWALGISGRRMMGMNQMQNPKVLVMPVRDEWIKNKAAKK